MTAASWSSDALSVRPPQQRRSRERWTRILDAGVALLEGGGYEAFTIAAVCERACVPPGAIYARTASKDALFLAVYEHGMARVRAEHQVLADVDQWRRLESRDRIRWVVAAVADVFTRHARFLRAVVLVSGAHSEVAARGRVHAGELSDAFAAVVSSLGSVLRPTDPPTAIGTAFSTVFASLVMRTAYGPGFASAELDDQELIANLGEFVADHLLGTTTPQQSQAV